VAGLDAAINQASDLYSEFEDYYYIFVDTLNYTNTTKSVLEELTVHIAAFQVRANQLHISQSVQKNTTHAGDDIFFIRWTKTQFLLKHFWI
jgi:hypothetical protein